VCAVAGQATTASTRWAGLPHPARFRRVAFDGTPQSVKVVAFDLGDCGGQLMYRHVTWYFPQFGGTFDPQMAVNICI